MASELDLGYAAGVIDSRAHIEADRARITVTTKRVEVLEWMAKVTGVGVVIAQRDYHKRGCTEHCEELHQHVVAKSPYWTIRGMRAGVVLYNVLPWLICARSDALSTLRLLAPTWPTEPARNELGAAMERLGWYLPTKGQLP